MVGTALRAFAHPTNSTNEVKDADDQTQAASVGEILTQEFIEPMGLTQGRAG
jgi:hypothetical protein